MKEQDRGTDLESLDKLMKTENIPEAHQDAFKTGFAEGFLKAQALTQKTNGKLNFHIFLSLKKKIYCVCVQVSVLMCTCGLMVHGACVEVTCVHVWPDGACVEVTRLWESFLSFQFTSRVGSRD